MRSIRFRGVTLLELMVVMSIIAVLLGIGMAMLTESRKDMGLRAARATTLGICRFARTGARNARAPVILRVDPAGRWLTTVVRRPMAAWHFDDGSLAGAMGHTAEIHEGKIVDDGHVGSGVLFTAKSASSTKTEKGGWIDGGRVPMMAPDQGLIVEVWYRPVANRTQRVLIRKSGEFGILIDKGGVPAAFVGTEANGVDLKATGAAIPESRWTKLGLMWDGKVLTLSVNDHPLARKAGTAVFAMGDAHVTIGSQEFPLDGEVDEVRIDALIEGSRYNLPDGLSIEGPPEIRFDATGALDADLHTGPATLTVKSPVDSASVTVNMLGGSQ